MWCRMQYKLATPNSVGADDRFSGFECYECSSEEGGTCADEQDTGRVGLILILILIPILILIKLLKIHISKYYCVLFVHISW